MELDIAEILRYMGHGGNDAEIVAVAEQAARRLAAIWQPRYHFVETDPDLLELPGEDIRRHLAGCDTVYVLCATLGVAVDREIRIAEHRSMLEALALDCAAGDGIEKVCDGAQEHIRHLEERRGRYITGRYSPGYGDLPLSVQPQLLAVCDAQRRIGLTLTDSGILTPRKSVTALIGASNVPVEGKKRGCGTCAMIKTCPYRKRGTTCGA